MPELPRRYPMDKPLAVVLSDLHFGEEGSVVHYGMRTSKLGEQPAVNKPVETIFKRGEQPAVNKLVEKIEKIKQQAAVETIPFLILAGDTLDFSLASVQAAVADFRVFLEDVHACFDKFVYIPGNHDHHMWRTLQEQVFVVRRIMRGMKVGDFPQEEIGRIVGREITLDKVEKVDTESIGANIFLNDLLPEGAKDKDFAVAYPNLFIDFGKPESNILVTHGHFFERAWNLASDMLKNSLDVKDMNYAKLERINSAVTEFGWYGVGQAGELSEFIEELYKEVKNSKEVRLESAFDDMSRYIHELWEDRPTRKEGFFDRLKGGVGDIIVKEGVPWLFSRLQDFIMSQLEEDESQTAGSPLRHSSDILTAREKCKKVSTYISYAAGYDFIPGQVVFGHTHIPIQKQTIDVAFGAEKVKIKAFNPGGWVVDSKKPRHVVSSCPMPLVISETGEVSWIDDFPWPRLGDEDKLNGNGAKEIRDMIKEFKFGEKPLKLDEVKPERKKRRDEPPVETPGRF
jgi:predicted phosphodiesterase